MLVVFLLNVKLYCKAKNVNILYCLTLRLVKFEKCQKLKCHVKKKSRKFRFLFWEKLSPGKMYEISMDEN